MRTSFSLTRTGSRFCTLVRAIPSINRSWELGELRVALRRRTFNNTWVLLGKKLKVEQHYILQPRKQTVSRATSKGREREVIPSLICSHETPLTILHSALRLIIGTSPEEGHEGNQRTPHL